MDLFCPREESLHQRFEVDLTLFSALIRFQISQLVIQMADRADPLDCFTGGRGFGCWILLFQQCLQSIGQISSRMGPAPGENNRLRFPVQLPVSGKPSQTTMPLKPFRNSRGWSAFRVFWYLYRMMGVSPYPFPVR